MLTSKEVHLERQKYYLKLVKRGDADVVAAIHSVVKDSRPGYTMESRPQSLFKLIKAHLDEPFRKWLERNEQSNLKDFSMLARAKDGLNNSPRHQVAAGYFSNGGISTATIVKSRCFQRLARPLQLSFGPSPCL